jgi:hypothetical protein
MLRGSHFCPFSPIFQVEQWSQDKGAAIPGEMLNSAAECANRARIPPWSPLNPCTNGTRCPFRTELMLQSRRTTGGPSSTSTSTYSCSSRARARQPGPDEPYATTMRAMHVHCVHCSNIRLWWSKWLLLRKKDEGAKKNGPVASLMQRNRWRMSYF